MMMEEKMIVDVPLTPKIVSVRNIKDSEFGVLDLDELPEGGWRAWSCVAGAFCIQMVGFGLTGSYGVYQDYYTRVYMTKENPSAISWIGSVGAFIVTVSGIVAGRLYDKGYFYHILYGGSALLIFSLFMLSLCQPDHIYQNFLAQAVGQGLGAGLTYVPSLAVASQYFLKKRALAMSIVAAGSSLGAIIHPIMLNNLFLKLGYSNAVRANAGMNAGLLIIACLLLRTRIPPPETVPPFWKSVKRFSTDWPYVFCVIGLMTMPFAVFFPIFYIQLDAVKQGLSENFAFYSLVILNGASIAGRITPGILARFISVPVSAVICSFACATLIYAMSGITTVAAFVIFGILFGFFCGAFIGLMAPLTAIFARDSSEMGLRMGIAFAIYGLGSLAGPPIQGALLGKSFMWWKPAVFSGSFALVGTIMFGIMIVLLRRRK